MNNKPLSIISLIFFVLMYIPLIAGCDAEEMRAGITTMYGLGILFYFVFKNKPYYSDYLIGIPLIWIIISGLINYVPGYTLNNIAIYFAIYSIIILIPRLDQRYIYFALILVYLIQVAYTYLPMEVLYSQDKLWGNDLSDSYSWGTVRHKIRFATLCFTGLIGCYGLLIESKGRIIKILVAIIGLSAFWMVFLSYSNTMIVCVAAIMLIFAYKMNKKICIVMIGIFFVLFYLYSPSGERYNGFWLDFGRLEMWNSIISEIKDNYLSAIFGRGVGAWKLINSSHPHNDLLMLIYNNGFVFVVFLISFIMVYIWLGKKTILMVAALLLSASSMTNSIIGYSDMWLIWAVVIGLSWKDYSNYEIC